MLHPDRSPLLPVLTTPRLTLRAGRLADMPALAQLFADPLAMRFSLSGPLHASEIPGLWDRLWGAVAEARTQMWCVERRDTGAWLGLAGGLPDPQGPGCELSYRLLPAYWGQGYATEAVQAVQQQLIAQSQVPGVAYIEPGNQASARVAEKCGLQRAGETLYRGLQVQKYVLAPAPQP